MKQALFLDDMKARTDAFRARNSKEYQITWASNIATFLHYLYNYPTVFDLISLDHDLGDDKHEGNGQMAAWSLAYLPKDQRPHKVIIHSHNIAGAEAMAMILKDAGYTNVIVERFNESGIWSKFYHEEGHHKVVYDKSKDTAPAKEEEEEEEDLQKRQERLMFWE